MDNKVDFLVVNPGQFREMSRYLVLKTIVILNMECIKERITTLSSICNKTKP